MNKKRLIKLLLATEPASKVDVKEDAAVFGVVLRISGELSVSAREAYNGLEQAMKSACKVYIIAF